jgi:hypothetical protein
MEFDDCSGQSQMFTKCSCNNRKLQNWHILAIPFMYCILTLFGSTNSAIPIFFRSASGHKTNSKLLSSARELSALPPFHAATLASTESASANFSSSAFSAAAFAARSRLTAASELAEKRAVGLPDRSSTAERREVGAAFLDGNAFGLLASGFAALSARIRPWMLVAPQWPPSTASFHTAAASVNFSICSRASAFARQRFPVELAHRLWCFDVPEIYRLGFAFGRANNVYRGICF